VTEASAVTGGPAEIRTGTVLAVGASITPLVILIGAMINSFLPPFSYDHKTLQQAGVLLASEVMALGLVWMTYPRPFALRLAFGSSVAFFAVPVTWFLAGVIAVMFKFDSRLVLIPALAAYACAAVLSLFNLIRLARQSDLAGFVDIMLGNAVITVRGAAVAFLAQLIALSLAGCMWVLWMLRNGF